MSEKEPDKTSDEARTGKEAEKNRDELVKKAEQAFEDARGKKPAAEI